MPRRIQSSPNCLLVDLHYQRLGIIPATGRKRAAPAWDVTRVNRLCRFLTITPHELGALAAVDPREMNRYLKQNKFPPTVALHFALLESWYLSEFAHSPQQPIVPVHLAV